MKHEMEMVDVGIKKVIDELVVQLVMMTRRN